MKRLPSGARSACGLLPGKKIGVLDQRRGLSGVKTSPFDVRRHCTKAVRSQNSISKRNQQLKTMDLPQLGER